MVRSEVGSRERRRKRGSLRVASTNLTYAGNKFLASNLKSVLGQFSEAIYASNADGTLVVGKSKVYDGTTFAIKRPLPITTTVSALSQDSKTLYLYDIKTSRIYIEDLSGL